jgi:hypothetical protein
MDGSQLDHIVRSFTDSRRSLLGAMLAAAAGWLSANSTEAKKKRKRKKKDKKPKPNEFGCLEVGDPCKSEEQCCSGICEGKRGKRTCRAHDTGTCDQDRPGYCAEGNPYLTLCNGGKGVCYRTTAGSNVCVDELHCAECQRDADCEALGHPAGATCAPVGGELSCAGRCESGMACVFLTGDELSEA